MKINKLFQEIKHPKVFFRKVVHKTPFFKKLLFMRLNRGKLVNDLNGLSKLSKEGIVFVFPLPSCPWGYMFQRPQQIARSLSKMGYIVIYTTDTSFPFNPDWSIRGLVEIEPRIYLFNDGQNGKLLVELDTSCKVIWQYWPHQYEFIQNLKLNSARSIWIYDCIDHISTFISYPNINRDYNDSIFQSDIVLATSKILYEEIKSIRPDVILIQNGVCPSDFETLDSNSTTLQNKKVVVGYYGAIAEWFDFSLVKSIAENRPMWKIVLVGEVYENVRQEVVELIKIPNIELRKRVSYSEIPSVLATFDVAILPFILNDITLRTSPVKVFEYLAGGKPAICTKLPELLNVDGLLLASNADEFINYIDSALDQLKNAAYIARLKKTAIENSWDSRVKEVIIQINKVKEVKNE